jgi:hypothetical protein
MQREFDAEDVAVSIYGLNEIGREAANPTITEGRDLPWLQDEPDEEVWAHWGAAWRDVYLLDDNNDFIERFNLTEFDLDDPVNYDALKADLLDLVE